MSRQNNYMGLLENRQGQGTFVLPPTKKNPLAAILDGHDISLVDLLEVRLGLECNSVMMAARRATEQDLLDLAQSLMEMENEVQQGGLGSSAENVNFVVSGHQKTCFSCRGDVLSLDPDLLTGAPTTRTH